MNVNVIQIWEMYMYACNMWHYILNECFTVLSMTFHNHWRMMKRTSCKRIIKSGRKRHSLLARRRDALVSSSTTTNYPKMKWVSFNARVQLQHWSSSVCFLAWKRCLCKVDSVRHMFACICDLHVVWVMTWLYFPPLVDLHEFYERIRLLDIAVDINVIRRLYDTLLINNVSDCETIGTPSLTLNMNCIYCLLEQDLVLVV